MPQRPGDLEQRLRACRTLPSLPAVALQIIDACQQPDASVRDVADCIGQDPALAAKVLKIANSPLYGLRSVTTVSHGAALLGLDTVRSIALSFSLVRGLNRPGRPTFDRDAYWRRSIFAAVAGRTLGEKLGFDNPEELFLGCLLQDIGMLAIAEAVPEYGLLVKSAGASHAELARLETQTWQRDHAAVSGLLLGRWNLPDRLRIGAERSHDPSAATGADDQFARCVALSGVLGDIWIAADAGMASTTAREKAHDWLQIDDASFQSIVEKVAEDLPEIASLFDIELTTPEMVQGVLNEAKQVLLVAAVQSTKIGAEPVTAETGAVGRQRGAAGTSGNLRPFEKRLAAEFDRAASFRSQLSLLAVDVDHLAQINNLWGRAVGDEVLQSVARLLATEANTPDDLGRIDQAEMLLLLPGANVVAAGESAERIRSAVERKIHTEAEGQPVRVTVSIGHATQRQAGGYDDLQTMLAAARKALSEAKHGGRNRVVGVAAPPADSQRAAA